MKGSLKFMIDLSTFTCSVPLKTEIVYMHLQIKYNMFLGAADKDCF